MRSQLDFDALEDCLKSLKHLSIDITQIKAEAGYEAKRGGYGDVQVSRLDSGTAGSKLVAMKTIYLKARHLKEPERLVFRLARELKVWARLHHPHVLPVLGYYLDKDYKTAVLVSEYMTHGNLKDYIEQEKPSWDVRLNLIRDTAAGLAYLHGQDPPILHGDLKSENVLMNAERRAILADFGLLQVLEEDQTGLTTADDLKGTLRYFSPELMREMVQYAPSESAVPNACNSLPSDIWAWACLALEALADRIPYAEKKSEPSIILALMNNEPPDDAKSLSIPIPTVRDLLADCWTIRPDDRPSAEHCFRILEAESSPLQMGIGIDDFLRSSHQDEPFNVFDPTSQHSPQHDSLSFWNISPLMERRESGPDRNQPSSSRNSMPTPYSRCRCPNKTAKPSRHWETACPYNTNRTEARSFECNICARKFSSKANLARHRRTQHNAKPELDGPTPPAEPPAGGMLWSSFASLQSLPAPPSAFPRVQQQQKMPTPQL